MVRILAVLLGISSLLPARPYCEVPDTVAVDLRRSGDLGDQRLSPQEVMVQRRLIFEGLVSKFPDDVQANREYIIYAGVSRDVLIERYKGRLNSSPNDSLALYFYGLTLMGQNPADAVEFFERALRINPEVAWAHVDLANLYSSAKLLDRAKVRQHIDMFFAMCPTVQNSTAVWIFARYGSPEVQRQTAAALRQRLALETGPGRLGAYANLWNLELNAFPLNAHPEMKQTIASDVRSMRARIPLPTLSQLRAMRKGFELVGDAAGVAEIDQEIQRFVR